MAPQQKINSGSGKKLANPKITKETATKVIRKPVSKKDFEIGSTVTEKNDAYRLSDVLAAIRRELEAVALIAESEEQDVPRFHISKTELDFSYSIVSLSDEEGLRVGFTKSELQDIPIEKLHRLKVTLIDADVIALEAESGSNK
ncbi:MAG: hypothetical protein ACI8R9_000955 [Paraglaciecola sp.]|jgi:hypothetical protein